MSIIGMQSNDKSNTLPLVRSFNRRQRCCTGKSNWLQYLQQEESKKALSNKLWNKKLKRKETSLTTNDTNVYVRSAKIINDTELPVVVSSSGNDNYNVNTTNCSKESIMNIHENANLNIEEKIVKEMWFKEPKEYLKKSGKLSMMSKTIIPIERSSNNTLNSREVCNNINNINNNDNIVENDNNKNICNASSNNAEEILLRDGVCYTPSTKQNLTEYENFLQTTNNSATNLNTVREVSHHGGYLEYSDPWIDKRGCYNRTLAAAHIRNGTLNQTCTTRTRHNRERSSRVYMMCMCTQERDELSANTVHMEISSLVLIRPETMTKAIENNIFEEENGNISNINKIDSNKINNKNKHQELHHNRRSSEEWLTHSYKPSVDPYHVEPFRGRCGYSDFRLRFNLTQPVTTSSMHATPAEQFCTTASVPLATPNKWQLLSSRNRHHSHLHL